MPYGAKLAVDIFCLIYGDINPRSHDLIRRNVISKDVLTFKRASTEGTDSPSCSRIMLRNTDTVDFSLLTSVAIETITQKK